MPGTFWVPISLFVTALKSFSEEFLREYCHTVMFCKRREPSCGQLLDCHRRKGSSVMAG
jgi:hypothetical protein